ncbi:AMIN-like domain-containing (lipo)protein [Nocardioides aestuarii]|uniref:AMIN-like domain-containing protein n=1 Tax=Nocardioides aestuarii TaxID=252231 RepID=A0ABW4TJG0_9ACTN
MTPLAVIGGALVGVLAATGSTPRVPQPPTPTPEADTSEQSGPWDLLLTDVRVGHHEGFDRVVLEFDGDGVPGWYVEYVDRAVSDGSGYRIRLPGESILQVGVSGTFWPGPGDPTYYDGPDRLPADPAGALTEVYVGGTFEGYTQVFVGLDGDPAPFEVFTLDDPARLVVDVRGERPAS